MTRDPPLHTPGWRDVHGLVHIAGTHSVMCVLAECGMTISVGHSPGRDFPEYEVCLDFPTCLMCIGGAIDYLPWFSYETVGVGYINAAAISKLEFEDG